ncbi:lipoprotein insertase outer membrane protein LolB [Luteimonas pelagia]
MTRWQLSKAAAVALVLLLSACAGRPVREAPPVAPGEAEARQAAREAGLRADGDWSLAGRVALTNGERGGSGRLDWRQAGDTAEVALSAPVTRQSWRLRDGPSGAVIEGLEGGPRQGPDAGRLLLESTGWDIPVEALPSWLRGVRAEGEPARMEFGADGRLAVLEQAGWRITFDRWGLPEGAPGGTDGPAMPHRIEATRGAARVRLLVDAWGDGAAR